MKATEQDIQKIIDIIDDEKSEQFIDLEVYEERFSDVIEIHHNEAFYITFNLDVTYYYTHTIGTLYQPPEYILKNEQISVEDIIITNEENQKLILDAKQEERIKEKIKTIIILD